MRARSVASAVLSLFVAVACGGNEAPSQSQGGGSAATGNNGSGGNNLVVGGDGAAASGNTANGSGGPLDPNSACANSAADGQPIPVDLYFMVDITGSMDCPVPDQGPCEVDPGPPT